MRYGVRTCVFLIAALIIILSHTLGFRAANAQSPVKADGISNSWRGKWDNRDDLWTIMTVRANPDGKAEVILANAQFKPYYNAKVEVKNGTSLTFAWGKSQLAFTLQPDGTLKGTRVSPEERNEITMTATPQINGITGSWEGIWGGQGQYWTVMSVQTRPDGKAEVIMTFVNGTPYSGIVDLKGDTSFDFKWGTVDHTFSIMPDGSLKGTRNWNGQVTPIILRKMFLK